MRTTCPPRPACSPCSPLGVFAASYEAYAAGQDQSPRSTATHTQYTRVTTSALPSKETLLPAAAAPPGTTVRCLSTGHARRKVPQHASSVPDMA
eukprot:2319746-Rhodomonas_salina.1